jgi:hypothetical protein
MARRKRRFSANCGFSYPLSMQLDIDHSVEMADSEGISHSEWIANIIKEKVEADKRLTAAALGTDSQPKAKQRPTFDQLSEPLILYDEYLATCESLTVEEVEKIQSDLVSHKSSKFTTTNVLTNTNTLTT